MFLNHGKRGLKSFGNEAAALFLGVSTQNGDKKLNQRSADFFGGGKPLILLSLDVHAYLYRAGCLISVQVWNPSVVGEGHIMVMIGKQSISFGNEADWLSRGFFLFYSV